MTTSIDNIPLKTTKNNIDSDDSDDPVVNDILNEFQHELKLNVKQSQSQQQPPQSQQQPQNDYVINYSSQPSQHLQSCSIPSKNIKNKINNYYDEDILRKTSIIIVIIALIFSPIIFSTIIDKIPDSIKEIVDNYNYYIKLILSFIAIYLLYYYNLL